MGNNLRFATLDMRGRLCFNVLGAIRAGVYDAELRALKVLSATLREPRKARAAPSPGPRGAG